MIYFLCIVRNSSGKESHVNHGLVTKVCSILLLGIVRLCLRGKTTLHFQNRLFFGKIVGPDILKFQRETGCPLVFIGVEVSDYRVQAHGPPPRRGDKFLHIRRGFFKRVVLKTTVFTFAGILPQKVINRSSRNVDI